MNPKIAKLATEIEKAKTKALEFQNKARDLERQKTELENTEIIALVRGLKMTPEQLADFLNGSQPEPNDVENEADDREETDAYEV